MPDAVSGGPITAADAQLYRPQMLATRNQVRVEEAKLDLKVPRVGLMTVVTLCTVVALGIGVLVVRLPRSSGWSALLTCGEASSGSCVVEARIPRATWEARDPSVPPTFVSSAVQAVGVAGLADAGESDGWLKVVGSVNLPPAGAPALHSSTAGRLIVTLKAVPLFQSRGVLRR